jgi:hypothetical protein
MLKISSPLRASMHRFFSSIYKVGLRKRKSIFVIVFYVWILIRATWAGYYVDLLSVLYFAATIYVGVVYYLAIVYIFILSLSKHDSVLCILMSFFIGFLSLEISLLNLSNNAVLYKIIEMSPVALLGRPSTFILGELLPVWNVLTLLQLTLYLAIFTFICVYAFIYYRNRIVIKLYLSIFLTVFAILYGLATTDQMKSKNELLLQSAGKAMNEYKTKYGKYPSDVWQLILPYRIFPITYHLQPISYHPESHCLDYGSKSGAVYFLFLPDETVKSIMGRSPCVSSRYP